MPSSGSGSVIRLLRAARRDHAHEQPCSGSGRWPVSGGLYVLPAMIVVFRCVENIGVVVFLNCLPIAWPAALVVACMMPGRDNQ